jgi:hypothetical protein
MDKNGKLEEALMKVALGYQVAEVTEEYAEVDGALKLTKRKKTKKDIPPDLKAVQLLLGAQEETGLETMTDEELEEEKRRLLETLQTENTVKRTPLKNKKQEGQVCVDGESCTEEVVKKARPKPRKRVVRKSKTEERK